MLCANKPQNLWEFVKSSKLNCIIPGFKSNKISIMTKIAVAAEIATKNWLSSNANIMNYYKLLLPVVKMASSLRINAIFIIEIHCKFNRV